MNQPTPAQICPQCTTVIAQGLLTCPGCHALVYADQLKQLAKTAEEYMRAGKLGDALLHWRDMISLLPAESKQHQIVAQKIDTVTKELDASGQALPSHHHKPIPKVLMGLGVVGLFMWKIKFILVFLLTKAKLLFMGLTKAQTFFSMFLAFGVYWTAWGWKFALGLILSIYVHEMGHVYMLHRFGIPASAPTFIPGVGAFVRLKQRFINPLEDARIGLAGPIWGLCAAIVCYGVFLITGWGSWGAIAKVGAWINLFNLLPIHPLDGGRGFHALNAPYKWISAGVIGIMWILTHEGLLLLLLIVAIIQAMIKHNDAPAKGDARSLAEYCLLVIILSLLCVIHVPVGN